MIKTFNCGVGFCIIVSEKNINKIKKVFNKKYIPYKIGFISKNKSQVKIINNIKW